MKDGALFGFFGFVGLLAAATIPAWVTHVVWVIFKLTSDTGITSGQLVLGVVGALMPPVGVVHGFLIWFGLGG